MLAARACARPLTAAPLQQLPCSFLLMHVSPCMSFRSGDTPLVSKFVTFGGQHRAPEPSRLSSTTGSEANSGMVDVGVSSFTRAGLAGVLEEANASKDADSEDSSDGEMGHGGGSVASGSGGGGGVSDAMPVEFFLKRNKEVRTVSCGGCHTFATAMTEWIPDEDRQDCMKCKSKFNVLFRRVSADKVLRGDWRKHRLWGCGSQPFPAVIYGRL